MSDTNYAPHVYKDDDTYIGEEDGIIEIWHGDYVMKFYSQEEFDSLIDKICIWTNERAVKKQLIDWKALNEAVSRTNEDEMRKNLDQAKRKR